MLALCDSVPLLDPLASADFDLGEAERSAVVPDCGRRPRDRFRDDSSAVLV